VDGSVRRTDGRAHELCRTDSGGAGEKAGLGVTQARSTGSSGPSPVTGAGHAAPQRSRSALAGGGPVPAQALAVPARGLSVAQIVMLQRTAGNGATAELLRRPAGPSMRLGEQLPRTVDASPDEPGATGPTVQRLLGRAELEQLAGAGKHHFAVTKRGAEYKALLGRLDAYHAAAAALQVGGTTTPQAAHAQLTGLLDRLRAAGWAYIAARRKANPQRAAIIEQELLVKGLPAERRSLDRLLSGGGPPNPAVAGTSISQALDAPVSVTRLGIAAQDATGGSGQLGHRMDVVAEIAAGARPQTPAGAPPRGIYGVQLEYWERVQDHHDFQDPNPVTAALKVAAATGADTKQWNDIYALKPDAGTFSINQAGADRSWVDAVAAAAAGTLTGRSKVGFSDYPGIWIKPNRYYKRTLDFRIVVRTPGQQHELTARQVLDQRAGRLDYSAYTDSRGNHIEAAGFAGEAAHGARSQAQKDQEQQDITGHGGRLAAGSAGSAAALATAVPNEAHTALPGFVTQLVRPGAALTAQFGNFVYTERNAYVAANPGASPTAWESTVRPRAVAAAGNTAGTYLLPDIPGTAKQLVLPSGTGLLVALLNGGAIWKVYYTTMATTALSVEMSPGDAGSARQLALRRYHEIPREMVDPLAAVAAAPDGAALDTAITAEKSERTGRATIAQRIDQLATAADAAGIARTVRRVPAEYDVAAAAYAAAKAGGRTTLAHADLDALVIADTVRYVVGADPRANVDALAQWYWGPKLRALLEQAVAQATGSPLAGVRTATADKSVLKEDLATLLRTHEADPARLRTEVMDYLQPGAGVVGTAEVDYRAAFAELQADTDTTMPGGWQTRVPADLAALSYDWFLTELGRHGGDVAAYRTLLRDFPGLEHRLKPAYRFLYGDEQLRRVVGQLRSAELLAQYDPADPANLVQRTRFLQHGPFTATDFVPSTGSGKFDATYDPATGSLRIVVKVAYEFADIDPTQGVTPAKVKGNEVDRTFARSAWQDDAAKTAVKTQFREQVLGIWAPNLRPIACTRPGWEDIRVVPTLEVREVAAAGTAHHKVKVSKAVMTETMKDVMNPSGTALERKKVRALKSTGGSSYSSQVTSLQEFDVADKISDPAVHRYLHAVERTTNIDPAYRGGPHAAGAHAGAVRDHRVRPRHRRPDLARAAGHPGRRAAAARRRQLALPPPRDRGPGLRAGRHAGPAARSGGRDRAPSGRRAQPHQRGDGGGR